jgi:hypothetical protein
VGKFNKCLHFLSLFIARKLIIDLIIQNVLLNIIEKITIIIPKPNSFTETQAQGSLQVCDLSSCNLLAEMNKFYLCATLLSCKVSELHKPSSSGLEPRTVFRCCGLCSCNILAKTNNFGLGAILLSFLVSELQKPSSLAIKPRRVSWGSGLCFCNFLFKTNNFGLGAVLL